MCIFAGERPLGPWGVWRVETALQPTEQKVSPEEEGLRFEGDRHLLPVGAKAGALPWLPVESPEAQGVEVFRAGWRSVVRAQQRASALVAKQRCPAEGDPD